MIMQSSNYRLKLPRRSVTALAVGGCVRGTNPGCAKAAPCHTAAYPERYPYLNI